MPKTSLDLPALTLRQLAALARRDNPGRPNRTATLCRIVDAAARGEAPGYPVPFFTPRGLPTGARPPIEQEALEAAELPALFDAVAACCATAGRPVTAAELFASGHGPAIEDAVSRAGYPPARPGDPRSVARSLGMMIGLCVDAAGARRTLRMARRGGVTAWHVETAPLPPAIAP